MKKRLIPILLGAVALAAALVGTDFWQKNYLASITTLQVPVPKADILPYTMLSADLFTLQEYPRALTAQGGYALSTGDLDGRISTGELLAGLPVPEHLAVPPDQFRLADPTLEVVSLPAEAVEAAGAQIHIGEAVNIYCLKPAPPQAQQDMVGPPPEPEVELVARVPIVDVLSDGGQPLTMGEDAGPGSTDQSASLKILVVAAPHETVLAILQAIALSQHEGAVLWVTLATP